MIKKNAVAIINDFSGGQDTRTPIISMGLNKSPNMRNFHCAGVGSRLMERGGFSKVNSSPVESDGLDVYYSPGYQTYDYPLRTTAAYTQISQGFKPNTSSTVTKVKLWLKKTGTPGGTDTITLTIQTDSSGIPSGSAVTNGAATAVDISDTLTTSYAWVTFTFATNPTLVTGTQYHLVLSGAFTVSTVNYVSWGVDNYDVIYPNGSMSLYDSSAWLADSLYDACFEVYITGGAAGNDGVATWDFSSKNMLLGVFGTTLYKMDKNSAGEPDGVWDAVSGGATGGTSQYPPEQTADYVKATSSYGVSLPFRATDPTKSLIGASNQGNDWLAGDAIVTNQRFHIDLGSAKIVKRIYYENSHSGGTVTNRGVKNFTFWGSNTASSFAELTYATDTGWTQITPAQTTFDQHAASDAADPKYITVTNTATYRYYAFKFADNWGSADFMGVRRIELQVNPFPITSSRFWTMADWQSGRALINTDIGLYTYLGTGDASVVSAAPVGKFTTIWKKYVFMAGIRGSPNTVRYSDLSDYTTWTAANTLNFDTSDGDVITGIRILRGKMYVFKRYSIHRVTYLGSNPAFQVDQVSGIGCPSHFTIKEVDMSGDIGTVLIFLTTDKKLAIFDGYNIQIISDVLTEETNDLFASADDQPLSFSDMNLKYVDLFHAQVKTDTSEYILYCVLGTDTAVNYAFVFDYKTGGIYPYDGQIFASSCYALSTNKVKKLYCSGYTGYTWLQESGNDDDGTAINAYWVSGKVKQAGVALLNKNLLLGINVKEITSSSSISISMQYRFDWNVSWNTAQTFRYDHNDELAFGKTVLFDIGSIENMLQIKLKNNSSNPAPTIYSLELYGEPIPLGVSPQDRATS